MSAVTFAVAPPSASAHPDESALPPTVDQQILGPRDFAFICRLDPSSAPRSPLFHPRTHRLFVLLTPHGCNLLTVCLGGRAGRVPARCSVAQESYSNATARIKSSAARSRALLGASFVGGCLRNLKHASSVLCTDRGSVADLTALRNRLLDVLDRRIKLAGVLEPSPRLS